MKKDIADRWVAALRSGDYKQCTGQLRDGFGGFCCLGVLCNLHAIDHPEIAATQTKKMTYLGEFSVLPQAVIDWAGLHSYAGSYRQSRVLAYDNDNGRNFKQIANTIEKHWRDL